MGHAHRHENKLGEAIRTILIPLISLGIAWVIYTTVETKSNVQIMSYQIQQISSELKELNKKVK